MLITEVANLAQTQVKLETPTIIQSILSLVVISKKNCS